MKNKNAWHDINSSLAAVKLGLNLLKLEIANGKPCSELEGIIDSIVTSHEKCIKHIGQLKQKVSFHE